ncbi:MAG: SbcC/MukB-like Walker B domain-containing protein [Gammaproteobacteria bacterium]
MKILSIHFKNINSVEGENRVDFRRSPFADAGVFAITGPNGSGKSSILDAITLGLYGETYRFDRPAMHVITRHTAEAFSEVEFAVGEDRYKSSWSVRREQDQPNGRLLAPEMKLLGCTEEDVVLAETPQAVCQRITEITGMNFRNFTRSIMLAQGDFAAFLNALDNERLDILEKIISTDIYSDYKNNIIAKADEAEATLNLLNEELSALDLLEPEKLEACEQDLADFKEQFAELKQQQSVFEQQQRWRRTIDSIEQRIAALTQKQEALLKQAEEDRVILDKIAAGQDALVFKEDCARLENSQKAIEETRLMLSAYRNELKQLQDKLASTEAMPEAGKAVPAKSVAEQQAAIAMEKEKIAEYSLEKQSETNLLRSLEKQRDEKQAVLSTVNSWLEEHAIDENLLENFPETGKLKNLRAQLANLTEKQQSAEKWVQNTRSAIQKNNAAIQKSTRKIAKLKLKLQIIEQKLEALALGRNAEQIDELMKDQQERIADFQQLYELSRAHLRLTRGRFGLFGFGKTREERTLAELQAELERYKDDLRREENIRKALEEAVANETLLAKMAADRKHLEDGKPCPLCGSLVHPYAKKPPVVSDSKRALADQRGKIQALGAGIDRISLQIRTTEKQNEANKANLQRISQLRSQWLSLCNRLNAVSEDMDINNIRKIKKLLKTELSELRNISLLAKRYRIQQKNHQKIKQLIAKHEASIEAFKANSDTLDAQWQNRPLELEELQQALAKCHQEEKALTAKVNDQLAKVHEKMPAKGKEDEFFDRMNQRRQDYLSYAMRRKSLSSELEILSDKIAACQSTLAEITQKLGTSSERLQREEFAALHLALIEKQKLIVQHERLLGQQEQDTASLRTQLNQKVQEAGFGTVDDLIELLHKIERKSEYEQQLTSLGTELAGLAAELDKERAQLAAEQSLALTEASAEDIALRLRSIAEKIDIAGQEIIHLEHVLGTQELMRQKYETLSTKLVAQEEIVQECRADVKQLEEEQGSVFMRRVQIKMADKLLAKANQVLEKINGRYYLRQMPSERGLALEIEDTYQHNARRLPKTLSGGESFVVSLALALALSELASNGRSVDSLFLDEGFGTLDAETLYVVLSTLEGLHTHGKKVGVISHVEAIQKRIKAQLQMGKKPNGMSYLKSVPDQEVIF